MSPSSQPGQLLAITGMDTAWGGAETLDGFEQVVYEAAAYRPGSPVCPSVPDFDREAVLERVSRRALRDSGIDQDLESNSLRIALILASSPYHPGHPVRPFSLGELFYDLSRHDHPLAGALDLAQNLLVGKQADVVVFAAYAAGGKPADTKAIAGFGFDGSVHESIAADGAGAVVWMLPERAERQKIRVYAVIQSSVYREGTNSGGQNGNGHNEFLLVAPKLEDVRTCCREAFEFAGRTPDEIEYIETSACGIDGIDGIEIAGLVQSYRLPEPGQQIALGSAQMNTGYLGAAAGLAGLIRASLCLHHRVIPGVANWNGPKLPALWRNTSFYVPGESRPWFKEITGPGRFAAVSSIGGKGTYAHLILQEARQQPVRPNRILAQGSFFLVPVVGDSQTDLQARLEELRTELDRSPGLADLAANWHDKAQRAGHAPYGLAVTGHSADEIQREVGLALNAIPGAFAKRGEWQTPSGSYCTANPAGRLGHVAFVYPGAFNSYPGVAKDLFRLFPGLYQRADRLTSDLGNVFRERMLYPRSLQPISKEEMAALEGRLLADPISMLITGTAISVMYTHLLQESFAIHPGSAFGYSLGENSMMYATGVWTSHGDQAAARLETSDAFTTRLAGRQEAIREFWQLDPATQEAGQPLWSNYLVMASPERVKAVLEKEPQVYMTHVNTPRQVVIGGNPQACQRVLETLRCSSLKAPFDYALHCEVMRSEYGELARLHDYPVENAVDLRMYTASGYGLIALEQAEISHKMADMLTTPLDFPRLVRKVYQDGARIFIEAGAGSNCARWIDEILKEDPGGEKVPHLSLSMNRRGTDDYHTLVRMMARLFSHRVPVDLSALYLASTEFSGKEQWRDLRKVSQ